MQGKSLLSPFSLTWMCIKKDLLKSLPEYYSVERITLSILKNYFSSGEIYDYHKSYTAKTSTNDHDSRFDFFKDLFQSGITGAYIAKSNYKKNKGKFSSYAYPFIKHEITECFNLNKRQISFSLNNNENRKLLKITKEEKILESSLDKNFKSKLDHFKFYKEESIDQSMNQEEDFHETKLARELYNAKNNHNKLSIDESYDLNKLINQLGVKDKNILKARYFDYKTLANIAKSKGISKEAVRKSEDRAIKNLKHLVQ